MSTISVNTGETKSIVISVVDADGVGVDVTGLTLSFVVENQLKVDIASVSSGSITIDGSDVSIALTSPMTDSEAFFVWSLRNTPNDSVLMQGPFVVTYSPSIDA